MTDSQTKCVETKNTINKLCIIPGRLEGKLVIVTGCNCGIGLSTAGEIARRGGRVIMACRNMEKAEEAKMQLLDMYGSQNPDCLKTNVADESVLPSLSPIKDDQLMVEKLDLSSLASVRAFTKAMSEKHEKIDILINNAGVAIDKYTRTEDGFEMEIGVNHLGPFLLTNLLLPLLKRAVTSRIINVSSSMHYRGRIYKPDLDITESGFGQMSAYSQSKLANVMHARGLAKRLEGSQVLAVSLHPGVVRTEFGRHMNSGFWKIVQPLVKAVSINPWQGAQTTLYTVLKKDLEPGGYYSNCQLKRPNRNALNDAECDWLWQRSSDLVRLNAQESNDG